MTFKDEQFDRYRQSLAAAGLATASLDSLICPLCWQETAVDDLSLEHVVPQAVGGKCTTLTCRKCNNDQGAALDSHLAGFQTSVDALQGHGTLPTVLEVNGNRLVTNLKWGDGTKNFIVVGKASNPAVEKRIKSEFSQGNVSELNATISFRYNSTMVKAAALRAAYLVLFKCLGYEYAKLPNVQVLRRLICTPTLTTPKLGSLVCELRNGTSPNDEAHVVVPRRVNGIDYFFVVLRLRKATTTYLGVNMPGLDDCPSFFEFCEQYSRDTNGKSIKFSADLAFW